MQVKAHLITGHDGYVEIKLLGFCDFQNVKDFGNDVHRFLERQPTHLIVNCELLEGLSKEWAREIVQLQNQLRKNDKLVRFVSVSPDMRKFLVEYGLDSVFVVAKSQKDALNDLGLVQRKTIDTEFVNPFLSATLHVLKVQANIQAEAGKLYCKKPEEKFVGDISGIIGIVSETFKGSIIISFPARTFLNVMSGMLGEEMSEMNQEMKDGAGEITNMIFGQAKVVLNEKGLGIKSALPTVVSGEEHGLSSFTTGPVVVVPFRSSAGDFTVMICLSA